MYSCMPLLFIKFILNRPSAPITQPFYVVYALKFHALEKLIHNVSMISSNTDY